MSRSHKKHCGSAHVCCSSDKRWKKEWHSAMRTKKRDMLILQMQNPEIDYTYPIAREVDDLWCAPSDGGAQWMYSGFEDYYFAVTHPRWSRAIGRISTRKEAWKEWITMMIGK